jgi:hypothetical protein
MANIISLGNINYWRIIEPFILGSIANIAINFFFNPGNPDFLLEEFFVAFIFALVITEINRAIDSYLERKINWVRNFRKRFVLHLIYLSLSLLFVVNFFGNIYIWISGDSFHSWDELIIINSLTLFFALLLTFVKWLLHFYKNWKKASTDLNNSVKEFNELKHNLKVTSRKIELIKGNSFLNINVTQIKFIKGEHSIVWVYFDDKKAIFKGTLNALFKLLPQSLFFQANRNIIIHRESILSLTPSTYGKIHLKTKKDLDEDVITVSRPKASSFRTWYYSNSTVN